MIARLPLLGKQDFYLSPRHLDIIGSGKLDRLDIEELLSSERKPRRIFRLVIGENKGGDNPSFGDRTIANGERAEQGSWPYAADLLTGKNQDPRLQTAIADTEHPTMTVPSNEELAPKIKDRLVSRKLTIPLLAFPRSIRISGSGDKEFWRPTQTWLDEPKLTESYSSAATWKLGQRFFSS